MNRNPLVTAAVCVVLGAATGVARSQTLELRPGRGLPAAQANIEKTATDGPSETRDVVTGLRRAQCSVSGTAALSDAPAVPESSSGDQTCALPVNSVTASPGITRVPLERARGYGDMGDSSTMPGVRLGILVPGKGKHEDYEAGTVIGVFWQRIPGVERRLLHELELSYGRAEAKSGEKASTLITLRTSAIWVITERWYAVGGISLVGETVSDEEFGASSATGSSLDIGGGFTLASADFRITLSLLLGSDNISDSLALSMGWMF